MQQLGLLVWRFRFDALLIAATIESAVEVAT